MTTVNSVTTSMGTIGPILNELGTCVSKAALWLNRKVEDITMDLPSNIAPIAKAALTAAPLVAALIILPRRVSLFALGFATGVATMLLYGQYPKSP